MREKRKDSCKGVRFRLMCVVRHRKREKREKLVISEFESG